MNIIKETKNGLLNRTEVKSIIISAKNPGFEEAKKMLVDKYKADEGAVVVKAVKGKFGRDTFLIDAFVYNSVKDKESVEPKPKVKKAAPGAA